MVHLHRLAYFPNADTPIVYGVSPQNCVAAAIVPDMQAIRGMRPVTHR